MDQPLQNTEIERELVAARRQISSGLVTEMYRRTRTGDLYRAILHSDNEHSGTTVTHIAPERAQAYNPSRVSQSNSTHETLIRMYSQPSLGYEVVSHSENGKSMPVGENGRWITIKGRHILIKS